MGPPASRRYSHRAAIDALPQLGWQGGAVIHQRSLPATRDRQPIVGLVVGNARSSQFYCVISKGGGGAVSLMRTRLHTMRLGL